MISKIIQDDIKTISNNLKSYSDRLSGQTLLITGGAGFIGKYILLTIDFMNKNMLDKPCKIICVDNFITGTRNMDLDSDHLTLLQHDVRNPLKIDEKIDMIIHAAGIASPIYYNKFKLETLEVGTTGTKNMLELAKEKGVKSFLFFSSSEVYGDPDPKFVPTPETYNGNVSCTGPRACYDESKRLGETLCTIYFQLHGLPIKIVRPFNVYGPGMRLDDYRVIPNFVFNAFKGNPLPVYGDGRNTRTFCYITDAITGFLKAFLSDHNGETFNIGNQNGEINVEDLAILIANIFNNEIAIKKTSVPYEIYSSTEPKRRCPDLTKTRKMLDYDTKVDLKDGVRRYIEWAREDILLPS
ncbi:MAG: NAD-dependent epimerase/dehydratase family protein [Candidatus Aenigmarchaeota archaeon]|nr:NAD-dependent epimerase/dehydratase family protein [Candidatus Aenigmarchaeota archaeon]